jgi:hypothetical protein
MATILTDKTETQQKSTKSFFIFIVAEPEAEAVTTQTDEVTKMECRWVEENGKLVMGWVAVEA